jgi:hypothetical protein
MAGVLGAAIIMAAAVATASANRLESSAQGIRAAWTTMTFAANGITTVTCPVTLEGTLHSRTITKVSGALIGYITRAIVGETACQAGRARTLPETLPWHVQYLGFTAAAGLPEIEKINIAVLNAAFLVQTRVLGSEISCLYRTSATEPATGSFNRTLATGLLASASVGGRIRSATGGLCPPGTLGGTSSSITRLGETGSITVSLI